MYLQNEEINNTNIKSFLKLLSKAGFSADELSLIYSPNNQKTVIYNTNEQDIQISENDADIILNEI
jgi:hypothetical protein